jgi:hypothetical protein
MTTNNHQRRADKTPPAVVLQLDEMKVLEKIGRIFGIDFLKTTQAEQTEALLNPSSESYISYAWSSNEGKSANRDALATDSL